MPDASTSTATGVVWDPSLTAAEEAAITEDMDEAEERAFHQLDDPAVWNPIEDAHDGLSDQASPEARLASVFSVRFASDELDQIRRRADELGLAVGAFIREASLSALAVERRDVSTLDVAELLAAVAQLLRSEQTQPMKLRTLSRGQLEVWISADRQRGGVVHPRPSGDHTRITADEKMTDKRVRIHVGSSDKRERSKSPSRKKAGVKNSAPKTTNNEIAETSSRDPQSATVNVRHVVPNAQGGWNVEKQGSTRSSVHAPTQVEAINKARQIVKRAGGGEVYIHGRDGRIRESDTVPKRSSPLPRDDTK